MEHTDGVADTEAQGLDGEPEGAQGVGGAVAGKVDVTGGEGGGWARRLHRAREGDGVGWGGGEEHTPYGVR